MSSAALFVYSSPASPQVEAEFDHWYETVHIPQVVEKVDGVLGARRFILSEVQLAPQESAVPRRRLAIYDIEASAIPETLSSLTAAMSSGELESTPTMDRETNPPEIVVYERL
jgi:hypothetical protein